MNITNLSPTIGPPGAVVTISGAGFGSAQGPNTVTFNGAPVSPTSWSDGAIVVQLPPGTTTGPVTVQVAGVEIGAGEFTIATDGRHQ